MFHSLTCMALQSTHSPHPEPCHPHPDPTAQRGAPVHHPSGHQVPRIPLGQQGESPWGLSLPQQGCHRPHRPGTSLFSSRSCSSDPDENNTSQAVAECTAIYYLLVLIILGFKFIYYVCKNGNTLASECLLGIQYPYYSKCFFSYIIEWFTLLLLYVNDPAFPFFYRMLNCKQSAIRIRDAICNWQHHNNSQHCRNKVPK